MSGPLERLENNAVEITSTLVTGIWLAALLTGQDWWLGALILGYVAVVPIVEILTGRDEEHEEGELSEEDESDEADVDRGGSKRRGTAREPTDEALATLRERYANGELTDEQFERKLERILEVETVEDASDYRDRTRPTSGDEDERTDPDEREREPGYN